MQEIMHIEWLSCVSRGNFHAGISRYLYVQFTQFLCRRSGGCHFSDKFHLTNIEILVDMCYTIECISMYTKINLPYTNERNTNVEI